MRHEIPRTTAVGRTPAVSLSAAEGDQSGFLVGEGLEHFIKLGELQQIVNLALGIEQLQPASLLHGPLVAGHQLTDAGTVHI